MINATAVQPLRRLSTRWAVLALLAAGAATAGALQFAPAGGQPLTVTQMHHMSVTDFSDDRRLVGFAEAVFIGRVAGEGTTIDKQPVLQTNFPVEVLDSIKGTAAGTVVVAQHGGYVPGANELRLMDGDTLLEPGKTYLFATRTDAEGRRLLVPKFGNVPVPDATRRNELQKRFTEAAKSPIAFPPQG